MRLIYSRDVEIAGQDRHALAVKARIGKLIRLRRGVYAEAAPFEELPWWEQQRVRIDAVVGTGRRDRALIRQSAAALWGIPVIRRSPLVYVLARDGTHGRTRSGVAVQQCVLLEPLTTYGGYIVTSRAQTVIDIAANSPFAEAVPAMDHVLRVDDRHGLAALDVERLRFLASMLPPAKRRRVEKVLAFTNGAAQSAGESYSRALMYVNHFPEPQLQWPVDDPQGSRVGILDFFWPLQKLAGEFDGAVKYSRDAYLKGDTPAGAVVREKKREDRIRATGIRVSRWMWDDIWQPDSQEPPRLVSLLRQAGLPQDRWSQSWTNM
ncbi:hypothetical protein [Arthrobacter sp. Marseille-P9274]|uniref:hypothetical protein n=1 Tax=Arthrobacter sp. Marseille-P9274 TaxID=2866572 RepID=UPI0021C59300|nr:hypothetical protein [Arthrobacter sp. Marseille-P9274]